jgi:hypothetical protein
LTTKEDRASFHQQDLYKTLDKAFPQFRTVQQLFDVPAFAAAIGMSAEGVYKWVRANKLSPEGAKKIIDLTKGGVHALTAEDLYVYVLR